MIHRFTAQKGNPQLIRMRAQKEDGTFYVPGDFTAMKLFVYETQTGSPKTASGGLTLTPIATYVLATPLDWDDDEDGYNVRVPVSGAYLTDETKTYRCEIKLTPVTGEAFYLDFVEYTLEETYSV